MTTMRRRGFLSGALIGGAVLGAGKAMAETAAQAASQAPTETPVPASGEVRSADQAAPEASASAQATQKSLLGPTVSQDWANLHRYHDANVETAALSPKLRRVVMMGDSITDYWLNLSGSFYADNGLIGRGIRGQTTAQMVVRFTADVLALKPRAVHIMAGTNDIAENLDVYDFTATTNNLQAMITLAKAHGLKVVMASVPPTTSFAWHPYRGNPSVLIATLNAWIKAQCSAQGLFWCDYTPVLQGLDGGLKPALGNDSVHPNAAGYAAMQPVTLAAIAKALAPKPPVAAPSAQPVAAPAPPLKPVAK